MWKTLALLWLIPAAAGLVVFARVANGKPPISDDELWLFGGSEDIDLSHWLWVKVGALFVLFFGAGLLQSLVVINLGGLFLALPLLTGAAALFIVLYWLR
jgi:hypothetical protein